MMAMAVGGVVGIGDVDQLALEGRFMIFMQA